MTSICLNMIVKDESEIIVSTFDNIRKYINISKFIISDTGSSDNTISIMEEYFNLNNLPYEIHTDKWVNFEHNRNLALDYCKGKSDYILFFDADDRINGNLELPLNLHADCYGLAFKSASESGFFHFKKVLIKNTVARWIGVLHESIILTKKDPICIDLEGNYFIQAGHFGSRSKNPNKYLDDALVLENAFNNEPDNSFFKARYSYYCATSYYSHSDNKKAIEWFKTRLNYKNNSHDFNEDYMTYKHLGMVYKEQEDYANAINTWLTGWNFHPSKAELLYEASLLYSELNNYLLAYKIALWGKSLSSHEVDKSYSYEPNIYLYGIDYQISKYGLLLGYVEESLYALIRITQKPFFSTELLDHIVESLFMIIDKDDQINQLVIDRKSIFNYITSNKCNLISKRDRIIEWLR